MIFISIDPALAKLGVNLQHKWTWKLSLSRWLLRTIGADWKTIDNPDLLIRWKSTNDHVDDKWVEIWNKGETWLTVFNLTFLTLSSALPCFLLFFPISLFNLGEPQADHPNCSWHCDVTRDTDVISYIYYIRNGRLGLIQVISRNASQNTVVCIFWSQMLMSCKKDK